MNTSSADDKPREECGVFGIYGHPEAAKLSYLGLYALQHRGQESAGIAAVSNGTMRSHKGMGLVADTFDEKILDGLKGNLAIGHVRYSTTGSSLQRNASPVTVEYHGGPLAVAHNGNLTNASRLRTEIQKTGVTFQSTIDSEVLVHLIARQQTGDIGQAIVNALGPVQGAYSLAILTGSEVIAVRDPNGFRPLCLGRLDDAWVVASETCAFDLVGATFVRDVECGEVVVIDAKGPRSYRLPSRPNPTLCIFEFIYFARPDSQIFGQPVQRLREGFGRQLAKEAPASGDVVISVPDSSTPAAIGYAQESAIPFQMGLIRSHYIGRTFIEPDQSIRDFGAKIKYNTVRDVIEGKRVVVVDDSIVRGTTSRKIVKMIRAAGAKEVHMRISSPPIIGPCYYGIDTTLKGSLIAADHSVSEIRDFLGADSLSYLSIEGMLSAARHTGLGFCHACFDGKYPVAVEDRADKFQLEAAAC